MTAIILVDLQNDFLPCGAMAVPQGDAVIPLANQLQGSFKVVAATQDWHPSNHKSFAASHAGRQPGDILKLKAGPQPLWPTHCVQHTRGAELAPGLLLTRVNRVFKRGTDPEVAGHSGFFDQGQLHPTGLHTFLREKKVTAAYVMGLSADSCLKFTLLDAVELGFQTFLIEDACRGLSLGIEEPDPLLEELRQAGVSLVQSRDLLGMARMV
jgi:nicotinamidase/pyrazinamidase